MPVNVPVLQTITEAQKGSVAGPDPTGSEGASHPHSKPGASGSRLNHPCPLPPEYTRPSSPRGSTRIREEGRRASPEAPADVATTLPRRPSRDQAGFWGAGGGGMRGGVNGLVVTQA